MISIFFRRGWHWTLVSILLLAIFLFPIYWLVTTAVKPAADLFSVPPKLIPDSIDWSVWSQVLADPAIPRFFLNSVIIAFGTTILTSILSVPCAYALAHLPIKGKSLILLLSLSSLMFPAIMVAIPLFVIFNQIGLVNSYVGLIFANTAVALPFAITILRPFFLSVPKEITEAAWID